MKIGIDAGGTLLKIAYIHNNKRHFEKHSVSDIEQFIEHLNTTHYQDDIYLTGGKTSDIKSLLSMSVHLSNEFDATYQGLKLLIAEEGHHFDQFVYLNVGTGTSCHHADHQGQKRIGGSGIGGGTLMGLSQLLTGIDNFSEITSLAKKGNRDNIDLKVHHIYGNNKAPLSGDLTASNFGNVKSGNDNNIEDQLQAVIALVAETVCTLGLSLAESFNTSHIVFIGSTLIGNDIMTEIINRYTKLKGCYPYIIKNGEFSGALGATLM
jgi:type II pantothenate kinase